MSSVEPNISLFDAIRLPTPTIRVLSRQTALSITAKVGTYLMGVPVIFVPFTGLGRSRHDRVLRTGPI
jgi:hypothetical protein